MGTYMFPSITTIIRLPIQNLKV